MTDDECNHVSIQLVAQMNELGLTWITDIVRHEIAEGHEEVVRVRVMKEATDPNTGFPMQRPEFDRTRGRAHEFLRTVDYTDKESLKLLIDAIERTVAHAARMETAVFESLNRDVGEGQPGRIEEIRFVPLTGPAEYGMREQDSLDRSREATTLLKLLAALRAEI